MKDLIAFVPKLLLFGLVNLALCTVNPTVRDAQAQTETIRVDPALPEYAPVPGIAGGNIQVVGSETMNNMMTFWLEDFQSMYDEIRPEIDSKGSSNAFPALIAGQANLGQMSREPKNTEIADFRSRYGYDPLVLPTAIDMVAVWVHKNNPIEKISFEELDAIFSSTRLRGARRRATHWTDLLGSGSGNQRPIVCYGRNAASGTYGFFKQMVLNQGDYGPWVNELSGSSIVAQAIGSNPEGIGYSGIGFQTANVKPLSVSARRGGPYFAPQTKFAYSREYPLSRFLYIILNHDPRQDLDPTRREFLRYIYSRQGQEQVVRDGYVPLTAEMATSILGKLGIEQ